MKSWLEIISFNEFDISLDRIGELLYLMARLVAWWGHKCQIDEGIKGWKVIKDMGWHWVGCYPRFRLHLQETSHVLESGVVNRSQEMDLAKRKHFDCPGVRLVDSILSPKSDCLGKVETWVFLMRRFHGIMQRCKTSIDRLR